MGIKIRRRVPAAVGMQLTLRDEENNEAGSATVAKVCGPAANPSEVHLDDGRVFVWVDDVVSWALSHWSCNGHMRDLWCGPDLVTREKLTPEGFATHEEFAHFRPTILPFFYGLLLFALLGLSACAYEPDILTPADGVQSLELFEQPIGYTLGVVDHPYFAYSNGDGVWETLEVKDYRNDAGSYVFWQVWQSSPEYGVIRAHKKAEREYRWRGDQAESAWRTMTRELANYPFPRDYFELGPNSITFAAWMLDLTGLGQGHLSRPRIGANYGRDE